jgi:hypothetical protein
MTSPYERRTHEARLITIGLVWANQMPSAGLTRIPELCTVFRALENAGELLQVLGLSVLRRFSISYVGSERAAPQFVVNMPANPQMSTAFAGMNKRSELEQHFASERRKRVRTKVHWPLSLFRNQGTEAVESLTQDLSSNGFYCLSNVRFLPDELLTCALRIPTHDPSGRHLERSLGCRARVLRVEPHETDEGIYGVACQIEDWWVSG